MAKQTTSTTVKVRSDVRDRINRLKDEQHTTVNDLLSAALDTFEEADFWRRQAEAHAVLQSDPDLRRQVDAATALWDNTLGDGLHGGSDARES